MALTKQQRMGAWTVEWSDDQGERHVKVFNLRGADNYEDAIRLVDSVHSYASLDLVSLRQGDV